MLRGKALLQIRNRPNAFEDSLVQFPTMGGGIMMEARQKSTRKEGYGDKRGTPMGNQLERGRPAQERHVTMQICPDDFRGTGRQLGEVHLGGRSRRLVEIQTEETKDSVPSSNTFAYLKSTFSPSLCYVVLC